MAERPRSLVMRWAVALCAFTLQASAATACRGEPTSLVVASTTSLEDTGLLDSILPEFRAVHPNHRVRVIAVGTGEALELGRRKDADVVIVHAPDAELTFLREGYGHDRTPFLRNDFVLAGPSEDPAGIRGSPSAAGGLAAIARARVTFVSRGDGSGTHIREQELWREARIEPAGPWYVQVGQGMGATLQVAGERRAYLLTDRASLLTAGAGQALEILVQGDTLLQNVYSVIEVSGAVNAEGAGAFARWISSPATARHIRAFGSGRYGAPLFVPLAREEATATPDPTG